MAPVIALVATGLAACGAENTKVGESSGEFKVLVTRASFPARQHVAGASDLVLAVRNASDKEIPQLVVTIWTGEGGVASSKAQGAFASPERPIWLPVTGYPKILPSGATAGADAAPTDSYVFGALAAGRSRTVVWRVTPVHAGTYTVNYAVAAGTQGDAKAVTADGPAVGRFRVRIDSAPKGGCVVAASGQRSGDCA